MPLHKRIAARAHSHPSNIHGQNAPFRDRQIPWQSLFKTRFPYPPSGKPVLAYYCAIAMYYLCPCLLAWLLPGVRAVLLLMQSECRVLQKAAVLSRSPNQVLQEARVVWLLMAFSFSSFALLNNRMQFHFSQAYSGPTHLLFFFIVPSIQEDQIRVTLKIFWRTPALSILLLPFYVPSLSSPSK